MNHQPTGRPSGTPTGADRETAVFRQMAFPVSVFDRIKDVQRQHEASTGQRLTLNQTVSRIVREHQASTTGRLPAPNVAREGRDHEQQQEAQQPPAVTR